MPKRLLRSVIEFDQEVSQGNLVRNFQRLRRAVEAGTITWGGRTDDESIYRFVESFFIQYFEMPSSTSVVDYFESTNRVDVKERVGDIGAERPYARTNFINLLATLQEDQARAKALEVVATTSSILTKGKKDAQGQLRRGVDEAFLFFVKSMDAIRVQDNIAQVQGDIRRETDSARDEYLRAESDRGKVLGVLSGIREIDEVSGGVRKGELWIHAGYPGELKTTFACNWAYNSVVRFKQNVVYVSFEMTREQIRRNILVQHSANPRFAKLGVPPLDYVKIRDGGLTSQERAFYLEHVLPDFKNNPTYTTFEVITPDRDYTMADVRQQIELLHREFEVQLVILDHGQWIYPRQNRTNKDYVIELNSVITDAKRLALTFDQNAGIPVIMLFQINRDGKREADKNEGVYKMNALTYANNAEKAADVITTTYLNTDLRASGMTKFANLKNRDNRLFDPFLARVQFGCRRISSETQQGGPGFVVTEHDAMMSGLIPA